MKIIVDGDSLKINHGSAG